MFAWLTPDKWSFTLSVGGGIPFAGSPWKLVFTGDALVNGHFDNFFAGVGLGVSSKTQDNDPLVVGDDHAFGLDLPVQLGFQVFDKWTSKGQVFFEFRLPIGRDFNQNYKTGLGFRFLF
jgi:hypothetical protein